MPRYQWSRLGAALLPVEPGPTGMAPCWLSVTPLLGRGGEIVVVAVVDVKVASPKDWEVALNHAKELPSFVPELAQGRLWTVVVAVAAADGDAVAGRAIWFGLVAENSAALESQCLHCLGTRYR